ncbi:MAG: hypothetical protein N2662_03585 [Bacteroidales bacterium]|nr:hypothetical protein [Bacteroidales bacterium]
MFQELIQASKLSISKGAYQLRYDEKSHTVQVIDKRHGIVNYVVEGEDDEMLTATYIYFGIKHLESISNVS